MEHHARMTRWALLAAGLVEAALMLVAIVTVDWHDRTQILMFLFAVLGYSIVCLGLLALGAHVSRVGARVVAALDGGTGGLDA
jgi:hypothetical protein